MEMRITATQFTERVDNFEDKVPDYDPRAGDHLWLMITMYRCDPNKLEEGHPAVLDHENLISVTGPGCYYCEKPYDGLLATRRCNGEPR